MDREHSTPRKPLRLWPGVVIVALQWLVMFGLPIVAPEHGGTAIIGGFIGALMILLWWLFLSRASWVERLGAIAVMVVAVAATSRLVHESIANGMMGFMLFLYAAPLLSLALVVWAAASRGLSRGRRLASMVVAMLLACGTLTLVRTNGVTGDGTSDLEWRWAPTAEEQLLARAGDSSLDSVRDSRPRYTLHVRRDHARDCSPNAAERAAAGAHAGLASAGHGRRGGARSSRRQTDGRRCRWNSRENPRGLAWLSGASA